MKQINGNHFVQIFEITLDGKIVLKKTFRKIFFVHAFNAKINNNKESFP
jgi:hypothetical protein